MDNETPVGPITKWLRQMVDLHKFRLEKRDKFKTLTNREVEILSLVASGFENPAIAEKLQITRATVQNHRSGIRQKLDIENQTDYVKYALAYDLIHL